MSASSNSAISREVPHEAGPPGWIFSGGYCLERHGSSDDPQRVRHYAKTLHTGLLQFDGKVLMLDAITVGDDGES